MTRAGILSGFCHAFSGGQCRSPRDIWRHQSEASLHYAIGPKCESVLSFILYIEPSLILRRQPTHHVLNLYRFQSGCKLNFGEFMSLRLVLWLHPYWWHVHRCIRWRSIISNQLKSFDVALLTLLFTGVSIWFHFDSLDQFLCTLKCVNQ